MFSAHSLSGETEVNFHCQVPSASFIRELSLIVAGRGVKAFRNFSTAFNPQAILRMKTETPSVLYPNLSSHKKALNSDSTLTGVMKIMIFHYISRLYYSIFPSVIKSMLLLRFRVWGNRALFSFIVY